MGKIIDRVREREAKRLSRLELEWRRQQEKEWSEAQRRQLDAEMHMLARRLSPRVAEELKKENAETASWYAKFYNRLTRKTADA